MRLRLVNNCVLIVFGFISILNWNRAAANDLTYNLRMGMVNGTFGGAETGEFSVVTGVDAEAEYADDARHSLIVRSIITVEPETSIIRYMYAGLGSKYYFLSRSRDYELRSGFDKVNVATKNRYYLGWEFGAAQLTIDQLTSSLSIQSTLLEGGITAGWTHKLSTNIGMQVNGSFSRGFGISTVAVNGTVVKLTIGLTIN